VKKNGGVLINIDRPEEVHVLKAYRNTKLIRASHFKEAVEMEGQERSYVSLHILSV
jgi:hypothetical protein